MFKPLNILYQHLLTSLTLIISMLGLYPPVNHVLTRIDATLRALIINNVNSYHSIEQEKLNE